MTFKRFVVLSILVLTMVFQMSLKGLAVEEMHFPYYIYHGYHSPDNHFIPSGWMGDYKDLRFDDHWKPSGAKDSKTMLHISYRAISIA